MEEKIIKKYLPLTEATYYILLCMTEPIHGYGIMQTVGEMTEGKVNIGPGTLYGATNKLLKDGLIIQVDSNKKEDRRKYYVLTNLGKKLLFHEYKRLKMLVEAGSKRIEGLNIEEEGISYEGI